MRRKAFEAMVRGMAAEMPPAFTEGILEIALTGEFAAAERGRKTAARRR